MNPKYQWDTTLHARHSTRVICDEEGLTWDEKNIITACIMQESQFNPRAIGRINSDGTQDFGLCQYNNGMNRHGVPYWIGKGAAFESVDEVLDDPEKNVRIMIATMKAGHIGWWASYSTGAYRKWLA
jgi:Transglycosylase SLT domain